MKNQAIHYLALDVHQATVVASMRNEQGVVVMRSTVRTEAQAILELVPAAGGRVHVAFEEGTQAQWLHDVLKPHADRVVVCNVRGKSEVANKSERLDADDLSERLRLDSVKAVYHGAASVLTLKELVRNYNSIVEDATRVMLRIKALFRARAIRTPGRSVYRPARRNEWLDQLTTLEHGCVPHHCSSIWTCSWSCGSSTVATNQVSIRQTVAAGRRRAVSH
jgi:hypothetical protein